jgi:hypothetical protein
MINVGRKIGIVDYRFIPTQAIEPLDLSIVLENCRLPEPLKYRRLVAYKEHK